MPEEELWGLHRCRGSAGEARYCLSEPVSSLWLEGGRCLLLESLRWAGSLAWAQLLALVEWPR